MPGANECYHEGASSESEDRSDGSSEKRSFGESGDEYVEATQLFMPPDQIEWNESVLFESPGVHIFENITNAALK